MLLLLASYVVVAMNGQLYGGSSLILLCLFLASIVSQPIFPILAYYNRGVEGSLMNVEHFIDGTCEMQSQSYRRIGSLLRVAVKCVKKKETYS